MPIKLDGAPRWLQVMRAITGTTEGEDDAKIVGMASVIAAKYEDMASYCAGYTSSEIAWCGLCCAFAVTMADIRPPFGPTDTDKFLWALAWSDEADSIFDEIAEPRLGCIVVMEREGGGHVTLYERTEDGMYICRGGNQSDSVKESAYDPSTVVALMWPKGN